MVELYDPAKETSEELSSHLLFRSKFADNPKACHRELLPNELHMPLLGTFIQE